MKSTTSRFRLVTRETNFITGRQWILIFYSRDDKHKKRSHLLFLSNLSTVEEEVLIIIKPSVTVQGLPEYRRRTKDTQNREEIMKCSPKISHERPSIACRHAESPCKDPEQSNISDDATKNASSVLFLPLPREEILHRELHCRQVTQ